MVNMDGNNNNYIIRKRATVLIFYIILILLTQWYFELKKKRKRTPKRFWVRPIFKLRKLHGDYHNLIKELRNDDPEEHFNYFRMSSVMFDNLLHKIGGKLDRIELTREPISPPERLAITLRYLASGDSMKSIAFAFRVGKTTVSHIVRDTCEVIWNSLKEEVLSIPTTDDWERIANGFNDKWNLIHCTGALDGKHVVITAPPKSGSDFYNYKGAHSLVLMAVCDHNYKFTLVDIGAKGRQSDGGIFRLSEMGKQLLTDTLGFPHDEPIEEHTDPLPYFFVADEAFPLLKNLMRPYPGRFLPISKRVFNYRLSRARRCIENAFGILSARWRILRRPINCSLETTEHIIKATVCLHNYLLSAEQTNYCPNNFVDHEDQYGNIVKGDWHQDYPASNLLPINRTGSNNRSKVASVVREELTNHFMFSGAVPFQWNKV